MDAPLYDEFGNYIGPELSDSQVRKGCCRGLWRARERERTEKARTTSRDR